MGTRELMFKSTRGYSMATKASGTLVLIIEKPHASWDLMVTASPALELHFRRQLRIASARPILGPLGPCARVVVHVYVELSYGLHTAGWTTEACLAAVGLMYCEFGCRLASYGARRRWSTVPRVCARWSQELKWDLQPIPMTQYLLLDVYCKG